MTDCIFCKIVTKELPSTPLYEDETVLAFPDIHPVKPIHLIVIPKKHISELVAVNDPQLFQQLFVVVQKLIKEKGLEGKGYRVVNNGGGAQLIDHLHLHIMGPITKTAQLG